MNIFSHRLPAAVAICAITLAALHSSSATDMIEIEARFIKATPEEVDRAILGSDGKRFEGVYLEPVETPAQVMSVIGVLAPADGEDISKKLLDKTISNPRLVTVENKRVRIQNVRDLSYPTKFSKPSGENERPIPTDFETRSIGITIELEPTLGSDDSIDLIVSPCIRTFLGFVDYSQVKPGEKLSEEVTRELLKKPLQGPGIWQPVFQSREISTEVTLYSGNTLVLGEGPPAAKDGQKSDLNAERFYVFITVRKLPSK